MKRFTILLLTIAMFISLNAFESKPSSDFCDGWKVGHCRGTQSVKGEYYPCPVTPVCPIAPIGKNDYYGGYDLGYARGKKDAQD